MNSWVHNVTNPQHRQNYFASYSSNFLCACSCLDDEAVFVFTTL